MDEIKRKNIPFKYAELGESDSLVPGQDVIAIGTPFGLARTMTLGIVSNNERTFYPERTRIDEYETGDFSNWIQMDTPIAPGNSGGPLVDLNGKVVGINTRGGGQNLNFAIPIDTAKPVIAAILKSATAEKKGRIDRSDRVAGSVPMKVDDHIPAHSAQVADERADRCPIDGPAVDGIDAVDAQPAVFVERHANRVDVPLLHGSDRAWRVFGLASEDAPAPIAGLPALSARELGAGDVDAVQQDRPPGPVDQLVAGNAQARMRRGGEAFYLHIWRARGEGEGHEQQAAHRRHEVDRGAGAHLSRPVFF